MRALCAAEAQTQPMLMGVSGDCCEITSGQAGVTDCPKVVPCRGGNATLAAFLVTRPPFGYIGSGWLYCDSGDNPPKHHWDPLWDLDTGVPLELCSERNPAVFSRRWSGGHAELDCNTGVGLLDFKLKVTTTA